MLRGRNIGRVGRVKIITYHSWFSSFRIYIKKMWKVNNLSRPLWNLIVDLDRESKHSLLKRNRRLII